MKKRTGSPPSYKSLENQLIKAAAVLNVLKLENASLKRSVQTLEAGGADGELRRQMIALRKMRAEEMSKSEAKILDLKDMLEVQTKKIVAFRKLLPLTEANHKEEIKDLKRQIAVIWQFHIDASKLMVLRVSKGSP